MTKSGASWLPKSNIIWHLESAKLAQIKGYLCMSQYLSDCTFVLGSETNLDQPTAAVVIPAHKVVLVTASPVFDAMFCGLLSERNRPRISIPDIPPQAFKALLQYIYTSNVYISSFDLACDLWYGARKYMLSHLENLCNSYIWSVLCPTNACQVYEFAWLFDEITLMDECIQIISTNTKEVLNDSSFLDLVINTVITVCSLDHLNVDSELDLFNAVARYAKAEQARQGQISPPADRGPPSEMLPESLEPSKSEKKVSESVESGSRTRSAAELDPKPPTELVTSSATVDNEHLLEEEARLRLRAAIENIRFLSLTAKEFAAGPARSGLLTWDESFAVLMNIASTKSVEPMPTGFSEHRNRRQPRRNSIDEETTVKLRPKPSTQSGGVAATKLLTPAEIVRGLSSREQSTLERSARAVRLMTCADADGTSENLTQLIAAGGIPPLVAALHHPSTGVKYGAAWVLTNIACYVKHTEALVDNGAAPALAALLGGGGVVAEQAAWALGYIGGSTDKAGAAVLDSGAIPALLARMQPSTLAAPLRTYVRTYRCICQSWNLSWKRFEKLIPAVPYIEKLLLLDDDQVLADACWILYYLVVRYSAELPASLPARIVALMRPATAAAPNVQTAAFRTVCAMLDRVRLRELCLEAGYLHDIVHFLKCGNPSQVKYFVWAAVEILHKLPTYIQQALDKGILDALVPALTEGDDRCKYGAVLLVTNLCAIGSPSELSVLAASAALGPYCRLLAEGDDATCFYVLQGLTVFLKKVEPNIQYSKIFRKLRAIGLPQLLIPLQQHLDVKNRKTAAKLLHTYFNSP